MRLCTGWEEFYWVVVVVSVVAQPSHLVGKSNKPTKAKVVMKMVMMIWHYYRRPARKAM
jgi:hypothetical protein